jgi:HTH-type transcriptional regulator/antitoxin HigA
MSSVMELPKIDERKYGRILSKALPRPIRNDKELEARIAELLQLVDLDEDGKLSPEEQEYSDLLGALIEQYEDAHYPIKLTGAPHERLAAFMEHRGLSQADIAKIIGSRSITSEILSGKREISKAVAKRLAEHLRAPVELFI